MTVASTSMEEEDKTPSKHFFSYNYLDDDDGDDGDDVDDDDDY